MTNYLDRVYSPAYDVYGDSFIFYSKFTRTNGTAPTVVLHHPHASSAEAMIVPGSGWFSLVEYLARHGYYVAVGDFKDASLGSKTATWGNDVNHLAITAIYNYAVELGASGTKKPVMLGFSMGAVAVFSYAARYPTSVSGCLGIIPALDINAYKTPGPDGPFDTDGTTPYSFASTINPAYNGNYFDGEYGTEHNPQFQAGLGKFNSIKAQLWVADNDTFASWALVSKFYNAVKASSGSAPITLNLIPGTGNGHTDASVALVPKTTIVSFVQSCVT